MANDVKAIQQWSDVVCESHHKEQMWNEYFAKEADKMTTKERYEQSLKTERLLKRNRLEKTDLKKLHEAEKVWISYKYFCELDRKNAKLQDNSLDESPGSHRLLEIMGEPLTVIQFRKVFKKIDQNHDQKMSMIEYLVYKYNVSEDPQKYIANMMRKTQGSCPELDYALKALEDVRREIARIEEKKAMWQKQIDTGSPKASQAKRLLADLFVQQEAIDKLNGREDELKTVAEKGGVKGIRAKQELNICHVQGQKERGLLWGLRRALKKAEAAVEEARKIAASGKSGGASIGSTAGQMWWVERELDEAKAYKPTSNLSK